MELHKPVKIENVYHISMDDDYLSYFLKAKQFVNDHYKDTLDRLSNTKFEEVSPEYFYKEYLWANCVSGFNSKIVSRFFPQLLVALRPAFDWIDNKDASLDVPKSEGLLIFGNERKIEAMIECARILRKGINTKTWTVYKNQELNTADKLTKLPYIGQITKYHLARNVGLLESVKPDLHLTRSATRWGFETPLDLCKAIQKHYDLPLGIIDYTLFMGMSSFGSK